MSKQLSQAQIDALNDWPRNDPQLHKAFPYLNRNNDGLGDILSCLGASFTISSITTSTTLTSANVIALVDASSGAATITLPDPTTVGSGLIYIKKTDSSTNAVTIDNNGAETIDGETSIDIRVQYEALTVVSDGTDWHII